MKRIRNIAICLSVALIASGCATGRIADLRDCGRASVGIGMGLGAEVGLGVIGTPSVGVLSHKQMYGWESRHCSGMWVEQETFWPASSVIGFLFRGWNEGNRNSGAYFAPYGRMLGDRLHPPQNKTVHQRNMIVGIGNRDEPQSSAFNTITDFECGATLGIISARAGINPLEIVDFIFGFVGIDIANDDTIKKTEANHGLESTGAPPAAEAPETHP